ncbi:hypothetical protein ESCNG_260005 [Neisseria gonorrhoeae]|uniref:Uncharacterized protein n=1 Tax=Neisseria gonorrhoeae TaxID=485 RepID=A0AB74ET38_NEIGO|nr:hypothetical protein ESCNG_260005 [Neisseria gonorrhoeae]
MYKEFLYEILNLEYRCDLFSIELAPKFSVLTYTNTMF